MNSMPLGYWEAMRQNIWLVAEAGTPVIIFNKVANLIHADHHEECYRLYE